METINDIVRKMRKKSKKTRSFIRPDGYGGYETVEYKDTRFADFADRIEAAVKREVGVAKTETTTQSVTDCNQLKMREALSDACYAMFNFLKTQSGVYEEMAKALDKAKAALSAPPRNCDIPEVAEGKPIDLAEQS